MPPYLCSTVAKGGDAEVEESLGKLLAGWLGRRRRAELGRRGRSTAELAEAKRRRERALERQNEDGRGLGWRRGVQVKVPGLTGGVAVDVRPPRVIHASAGRRLTKLNRTIQSSSTVSETKVHRRFTLSSLDGFGSNLFLWTELHEFYNFDYKIKA